jgi:hypothetical protein
MPQFEMDALENFATILPVNAAKLPIRSLWDRSDQT